MRLQAIRLLFPDNIEANGTFIAVGTTGMPQRSSCWLKCLMNVLKTASERASNNYTSNNCHLAALLGRSNKTYSMRKEISGIGSQSSLLLIFEKDSIHLTRPTEPYACFLYQRHAMKGYCAHPSYIGVSSSSPGASSSCKSSASKNSCGELSPSYAPPFGVSAST